MLVDLIKQEVIDKRSILLRYGTKVGLNSNQILIVLLIMELNKENKKVIASSELSEYLLISADKIDEEIDKMINKKLVVVNSKSIDFTNLFINIMNLLVEEYSDFDNSNFLKGLNSNLATKVSLEELTTLNHTLKNISKEEILELSQAENVHSFKDLMNSIDRESKKKVKQITKYNWLDD